MPNSDLKFFRFFNLPTPMWCNPLYAKGFPRCKRFFVAYTAYTIPNARNICGTNSLQSGNTCITIGQLSHCNHTPITDQNKLFWSVIGKQLQRHGLLLRVQGLLLRVQGLLLRVQGLLLQSNFGDLAM